MALDQAWVRFLRDQFLVGSRICVTETNKPNLNVGEEGLLMGIDNEGRFSILLNDGRRESLQIGEDRFSVSPPPLQKLKLFMPLTAELDQSKGWDFSDDMFSLTDRELLSYSADIHTALEKFRMPEEAERGIMHWYGEDDSVNRKVHSVVFTAEERNHQLWGVAVCQIHGALDAEELSILKEYVSGQASDGWGESFEQHEISVHDGQLYVHLWNFDDWSIETEQERFGVGLAKGLPSFCYSTLPSTGELITIQRGESGFYTSSWGTDSRDENLRIADEKNREMGVTDAQRRAMEVGSMCGWNVPGADPACYQEKEIQQTNALIAVEDCVETTIYAAAAPECCGAEERLETMLGMLGANIMDEDIYHDEGEHLSPSM